MPAPFGSLLETQLSKWLVCQYHFGLGILLAPAELLYDSIALLALYLAESKDYMSMQYILWCTDGMFRRLDNSINDSLHFPETM